MQRTIGGLVGIAVVVFIFIQFINAQDGVDVADFAPQQTQSSQTASPTEQAAPTATPTETPTAGTPAESGIDAISVTPVKRIPDYDRDLFGGWADTDGNGCRTRDDILARDMTGTTTADGCKVLTGVLADPYSGQTVPFTFGEKSSQAVQIDHVVALSAAWKAGAYAWDEDTRIRFANDPRNLLAVDGPTNNSKSDRGPASWMPSVAGNPAYDCQFATRYTDVLVAYDLTAPAEDIAALRKALGTC